MKTALRLLPGLIVFAGAALAQDVTSLATSASPPAATSTSTLASSTSFIYIGDFAVHPRVNYEITRAEGIQRAPGLTLDSTIQRYAAGLTADLGETLSAGYTATWSRYSNSAFSDTLSHNVLITANHQFDRLTLSGREVYNAGSSVRVETGGQSYRETSVATVNADYQFTADTALALTLRQDIQFLPQAPDSYDYTATALVRHRFTTQVSAGLGSGFGYVSVDSSPDMRYVRPQADVTWTPTDRVTVTANAGNERRKFVDSGAEVLNTPFYGASMTWQPTDVTTVSIDGNRSISSSYFSQTVTRNRTWDATFRQRLLGQFFLTGIYTDQNTRYIATAAALTDATVIDVVTDNAGNVIGQLTTNGFVPAAGTPLREDKIETYNIGLSTTLVKRVSLSASYQHSRNRSSNSNYSYSSDQYRFSAGITF